MLSCWHQAIDECLDYEGHDLIFILNTIVFLEWNIKLLFPEKEMDNFLAAYRTVLKQ